MDHAQMSRQNERIRETVTEIRRREPKPYKGMIAETEELRSTLGAGNNTSDRKSSSILDTDVPYRSALKWAIKMLLIILPIAITLAIATLLFVGFFMNKAMQQVQKAVDQPNTTLTLPFSPKR